MHTHGLCHCHVAIVLYVVVYPSVIDLFWFMGWDLLLQS